MNYKELKKRGIKLSENDIYDGGIYLSTYEYYFLDGEIYTHEIHPNANRYTGKTHTEIFPENYYNDKFCELLDICKQKGLILKK